MSPLSYDEDQLRRREPGHKSGGELLIGPEQQQRSNENNNQRVGRGEGGVGEEERGR